MQDGKIMASYIGPSTVNPTKTARQVYQEALSSAGIEATAVNFIIGTGYGRARVEFANDNVSEISCHAKGAHFVLPSVRTIIDIGGQDTKAININKAGMINEFVMNDKCAAGTGRFLDFMARTMDLDIRDMARLHFNNGDKTTVSISTMCSVFAESEVINYINEEVPLPAIIRGLHMSIANRVSTLARRVGLEMDVVVTGGVAKNKGVMESLKNVLKIELLNFPEEVDPQIIGALGSRSDRLREIGPYEGPSSRLFKGFKSFVALLSSR